VRRAAVWVVALLAILYLLARAAQWAGVLPIWRDAVEAEIPGDARHAGGRGAAALLVPDAPPRVADFPSGEWTYGWLNFLQQEIGPYTVLRPSELRGSDARIAIVPRALAGAPRPELLEWAAGGGTVVVECPGPGWAERLGSTGPRGTPRLEEVRSDLLESPLRALLAPCPAVAIAGEVMAGDGGGRPLVWRTRRDGATWIALGFDLSLSLLAMQQGVPADDLRLVNRFEARHGPLLQTSDLVLAEEFLDAADPAADRLERLLGLVLDEAFPRPRLWYHPAAASGLFAMTHDDEAFGDRSRWMTEHEARIGARSTSLFQPGRRLTREGLGVMIADGSEPGLHWNRLSRAGADYEAFSWLGIEWARRRTTLAEQAAWLRALLPDGLPLEVARTHVLTWGPDYGSGFRALAAEGFVGDSSYGVDFGERGYLFGTGRPFQAIDANGLPLPIWEVPHLMAEDLAADRAWLDALLLASERTDHQVINVLFHPIDMEWRPSVGLYRLWKESYDLAAARGHAIATLGEAVDFWRRRIRSRVEIEPLGTGLLVRADVEGDGHAVALPATWRGAPLHVAGLATRRVREGTRETILVPVPAGASEFQVQVGDR
jgi:hypothetical protein